MLVGYARISREEQNISLQYDALKKVGVDERHIFKDEMSGAVLKRPGLTECLEFLKEGDTLVVYKLDRLGRSIQNLITTMEELKTKKINFQSITENIDTSSISGQLIFHILAVLSDFERSLIIERTNAGLAAARKRGVILGRKTILTEDQKKQIIELAKDKKSISYIARLLNVSRTPIRNHIREARRESPGIFSKNVYA